MYSGKRCTTAGNGAQQETSEKRVPVSSDKALTKKHLADYSEGKDGWFKPESLDAPAVLPEVPIQPQVSFTWSRRLRRAGLSPCSLSFDEVPLAGQEINLNATLTIT